MIVCWYLKVAYVFCQSIPISFLQFASLHRARASLRIVLAPV